MIVGGYTLDLYCDGDYPGHAHGWIDIEDVNRGTFPVQFVGRSERECKAEARKHGWRLRNSKVLCPMCKKYAVEEVAQ